MLSFHDVFMESENFKATFVFAKVWAVPYIIATDKLISGNPIPSFTIKILNFSAPIWSDMGPASISETTSCCKISQNLEAARIVSEIVQSLWNLSGTSAAVLRRCRSNFKAILIFQHSISRLRDFARSHDKTPYQILKQGSGVLSECLLKNKQLIMRQ